jgi:hypothetical protein
MPPIPAGCFNFAKHDFSDGEGLVDIFWCGRPFWSHDHGEPWKLSDLDGMSRQTVASRARCWFLDIEAEYGHGNCPWNGRVGDSGYCVACEARESALAWKKWGELG